LEKKHLLGLHLQELTPYPLALLLSALMPLVAVGMPPLGLLLAAAGVVVAPLAI
jgi:hypothetical protein